MYLLFTLVPLALLVAVAALPWLAARSLQKSGSNSAVAWVGVGVGCVVSLGAIALLVLAVLLETGAVPLFAHGSR